MEVQVEPLGLAELGDVNLAAVAYDDRLLIVSGYTTTKDLTGLSVDELDAEMSAAFETLYDAALVKAAV